MADPIHQFEIKKLLPLGTVGGHEIAFTNSALFMGIAVAGISLADDRRNGEPRLGAGAHAVARRNVLRIRRRHDPQYRRAGRHAVLPVRVHAVHVHPVPEHARPAAACRIHRHQPHRHHGGAGAAGVHHRHRLRPRAQRPALLQAVRAERHPDLHPAAHRPDRGDVVPVAPDLAQRPPVRQHAGRPHHAESVRRLRGHARRASASAAGSARSCRSRSRSRSPRSSSWWRSCRPTCSPS